MTLQFKQLVAILVALVSSFAHARSGDHEVIGLHIGIGAYSSTSVSRLTLHRTTDEHLLPLFTEKYSVRWLPSVLDVDRQGFRDALLGLLREAVDARSRGPEITALLVYTGHGSRVRDQDGDEPDNIDETFVTVHGSLTDGSQDVRDDDIHAFRMALAAEGIHFTLIAESCHSESSSRGPPTLNIARGGFSAGPKERLFIDPAFDRFYAVDLPTELEPAEIGPDDLPSFVSITAAADRQLARTLTVDGIQWGVFSLAMYRTVIATQSSLTYADLFAAVSNKAERIDHALAGTPQTPFLHSDGADAHRTFLGRDPIPFAIRVREQTESTAVLSAGLEAGLVTDTVVEFYRSLEDLTARSNPVAKGVVSSSSLGRALVDNSDAEAGMFCQVISYPLAECSVFLGPDVLDPIRAALIDRQSQKSLNIAESVDTAMFSIEMSADGSEVHIRWVREPTFEDIAERVPPIARIPAKTSTAAWNSGAVTDELARLVRVRRLIGLEHRSQLVGVQWSKTPEELEGHHFDDIEVEKPTLSVQDGGRYYIKIRNNSESDMFFHLIEAFETDTGALGAHLIRQNRSGIWQDYVRLPPSDSHSFSRQVAISPGAGRETVTHLWLATSKPMENLGALISPRGVRATRGQNPVLEMLDDAAGTRSAVQPDIGEWSARPYRFSIVKPDAGPQPHKP